MASGDYVLRALSDAHLRAIGKVSAQWSSLESSIIWAISEVALVPHHTVLVMVGTQGVRPWFEILRSLSDDHLLPDRPTILGGLWTTVERLQGQRNAIVHCNWDAPMSVIENEDGGADVYYHPKPKSSNKAAGQGISRSKKAPVMEIAFTAKEMLKVAREIEEAQRVLLVWVFWWKKERQPAAVRKALASPPLLGGN